MRLLELIEDDDKQFSCHRFCFILGVLGLFGFATAQFLDYGELPESIYLILATMASGGYIGGKYNDRKQSTAEYDVGIDAESNQ